MLTFAAPAFLWTLLALPVVVLLHRVRVRRQRREVAGLFLWRQARDVGSRRPRFHAGLLLLLQLLAVAGLALALARPQLRTDGPVDHILVIDASASMAATDAATTGEPDGAEVAAGSRFDAARALATRLAAEAGRVAVIRAGREPHTVLGLDPGPLPIRDALEALRAGDAGSDDERALLLARDLAAASAADAGEAAPAPEIHWLSDRPPPATAGVVVHPLAGTGTNLGITGFEVVAGQAWVRLSSNAVRPIEVPVRLLRGDEEIARTSQVVPARGDVSFTLPIADGDGTVAARVDPPDGDALALDDVAYAGSARLEVGLESDFAALERALGAIPDVRTRVGASVRRSPLDLRVLTARGGDEPAPPGAVVLLPPRDAPAVAAEVLDWDRTDPLLRFVDLRELVVALVDPPPFDEEEGWTTLVRGVPLAAEAGTEGEGVPPRSVPLLQRADRPSGPVWRFAFHPVRGDLTLRPAFPTLVVNLVDRVRGVTRLRLGETLPGEAGEVVLEPGPYRIDGRTVHASLLDEGETRLPGPEGFAGIDTAASDGVAGAPQPAPQPSSAADGRTVLDLRPAAAALVLALVLAEWWGFSGGGLPWRRLRAAVGGRVGRR